MAADWSGRRLNVKAYSPVSDTIAAGRASRHGEKAGVPQAPNNNASSRRIRWRSINEANAIFDPLLLLFVQFWLGQSSGSDMHLNNTTTIGHRRELVTISNQWFRRGPVNGRTRKYQPADGIDFFIAEVGAESVVKSSIDASARIVEYGG